MYRLSIFFKHSSDERVKIACDRVSGLLSRITRAPFRFDIEEPDEFNDYFMARGHLEVPNKQFVRLVVECLQEDCCEARVVFTKKAYYQIEGVIEGNAWGANVTGPLDEIYPIAKAFNNGLPSVDNDEQEISAVPVAKPTKYRHLRLVE